MKTRLKSTSQVSEADVCALAASISTELADAEMTKDVESARFLSELSRLNQTGHSARLYPKLESFGLTANIPETLVDVDGLSWKHPVLRFRDTVKCLSDHGKMHLLLPGDVPLDAFWGRYKMLEPHHPIFVQHADRLRNVVPLLVHADEGTSQKKRALMILNIQPLIGKGTSRGGSQLNFIGHSMTTRFLYTCMVGKLYAGNKAKRLQSIVNHMALELQACFNEPTQVFVQGEPRNLYFCCIAMKGDWPALAKIGGLSRHHLRDSSAQSPGICHLCKAGQPGYEWHRFDFDHMSAMHEGVAEPFKTCGGGPLTTVVPQPATLSGKAGFFKPDIFHNCHKGVVGDLAANAIAP